MKSRVGSEWSRKLLQLLGSIKDSLEIKKCEFKVRPVSIDLSPTISFCTFVGRDISLVL